MELYCLKCKGRTPSEDIVETTSANGRSMIKGKCKDCGARQTQFMRQTVGSVNHRKPIPKENVAVKTQQEGGSIVDKLINSGKLPELHYWSPFTGKRHNFTGPGTKLEKRIDPKTKKPLPHSQPVNEVDKVAYHHDLAYDMLPDHKSRKVADYAMIDDLDAIYQDKKLDWRTRADAKLVGLFMKGKRFLGLGKRQRRKRKTRRS